MDYVISEDMKAAYDTIQHKTLINILSKKIKDKKVLKFIYSRFKNRIIFKENCEHTITGTP